MSKQLKFTFKDKEYTLEFTRRSVERMERDGFVGSDMREKPMTTLPTLFRGAFYAHHPFMRNDIVDEIYAKLTNKQELIGKLAEMYNEPKIASWIKQSNTYVENLNLFTASMGEYASQAQWLPSSWVSTPASGCTIRASL